MVEHEFVLAHDLAAGRLLRVGEPVANDLEHDVVAGHREDEHHHAGDAPRVLEPLVGRGHVGHEVPVQLRLAVFVVPERRVELGPGLVRHEALEVDDKRSRGVDGDVERRPGVTEEDGDVVDLDQGGADREAPAGMVDGEHEGKPPRPRLDGADEVGALAPVEDRAQRLDDVDATVEPEEGEAPLDLLRGDPHVPAEVLPPAAEWCIGDGDSEQVLEVVSLVADDVGCRRGRCLGLEELDRGIDAAGVEHASRDGVVERPGRLTVVPIGDEPGVRRPGPLPPAAVGSVVLKRLLDLLHRFPDDCRVQVPPRGGVVLEPVPVAGSEPVGGPRRDRREHGQVPVVTGGDRRSSVVCLVHHDLRGSRRYHPPAPQRPVWNATRCSRPGRWHSPTHR